MINAQLLLQQLPSRPASGPHFREDAHVSTCQRLACHVTYVTSQAYVMWHMIVSGLHTGLTARCMYLQATLDMVRYVPHSLHAVEQNTWYNRIGKCCIACGCESQSLI